MNYVYVAGGGTPDIAMEQAITRRTGFALYSLIYGLRQKDFGLHTVEGVACDIREFIAKFISPIEGQVVTDSGGYSFIKGDIPPSKLSLLIDCYNVYLGTESSVFDYIFSLDIPFSMKYDAFNTKQNVYNANYESLHSARCIIDRNKTLRDKFYFVWHFKMIEQYAIWMHLYKELELHRFVKNHAIGGMVGLKAATKIKFAPFTGMSFGALQAYLESDFVGEEFRLHFLGVYSRTDRFHIAVLQKLFRKLLEGVADVQMSYDSINPIHTVRMNAQLPLYDLVDEHLEVYPTLIDAPIALLSDIATDNNHVQAMLQEIERRKQGAKLINAAAFSPLNVHSNMQLDKFFEMLIDKYDIVGELCSSTSPTNLIGRINRAFDSICMKYKNVFSEPAKNCILQSLERTWYWQRWFSGKRDLLTFEAQMMQSIKEIGFAARLN